MCGREVARTAEVKADEDEEGDPEAPEQHPPAQHDPHSQSEITDEMIDDIIFGL